MSELLDDCGIEIQVDNRTFRSSTGNRMILSRRPILRLSFKLDMYDNLGKPLNRILQMKNITKMSISEERREIKFETKDEYVKVTYEKTEDRNKLGPVYDEIAKLMISGVAEPRKNKQIEFPKNLLSQLPSVSSNVFMSSPMNSITSRTATTSPRNYPTFATSNKLSPQVQTPKRRRVISTITPKSASPLAVQNSSVSPATTDKPRAVVATTPQQLVAAPVSKDSTIIKHNGLINTGNSCYQNALLQCILRLRIFVDVLKDKHKSILGDLENPTCVQSLAKTMNHFRNPSSSGAFNAEMVKLAVANQCGVTASKFAQNTQQDAHEFFVYLMECLEQELGKQVLTSKTQLSLSFRLQCDHCEYHHEHNQVFLELSLDLPKVDAEPETEPVFALQDLVKQNCNKESPIPDFSCDKCNSLGATQVCTCNGTGSLLVLRVNRFGDSYTKRRDRVSPCRNLVIGKSKFTLRSIVFHKGLSFDYGHYISAVEQKGDDMLWSEYNDERVTQNIPRETIWEDHRHQREVYMLFYEKKSSIPASNL